MAFSQFTDSGTTASRARPSRALRVGTVAAAGVLLISASAGCADSSATSSKKPATILTNWFPQAELGGYWQAAAGKQGDDRPLKILPGGPGIQTIPQVASGKAIFGVATGADDLLVARKQGLPIVAVFAPFRANITCLTAHASAELKSFSDLNGRKVAKIQSRPWWDYLKARYKLKDVKEINYTGSLAVFKKDKTLVQQCYVTSEPYYLKRDKVPVTTLSISDQGGYQAYSNILFTTEKVIKEDPELVRSVVQRVAKGWQAFSTDPAVGKKEILAANKEADPGVIDYAVQTMRTGKWISTPPGSMSEAQWKKIRDQVALAGLVPDDMDYRDAFTTEFLSGD